MAILKFKKLLEDLQTGSVQVLPDGVGKATSSGAAGTAYKATSAAVAGSAANAGTARVAHFGSSGTAGLSGTSAFWSTAG
jgi:hypothetical protein